MEGTTAALGTHDAPEPRSAGDLRLLTVGASVTVACLSLIGLTHRPIWVDEAFSLAATTQLAETLELTAGTMALYYLLLDWWTALVGTSTAALRALSVAFAVVTVPFVVSVARRALRPHEVAMAVVAVAILPAVSRYGQEARSYALVTLVVAASWVALIRAVDASGDDDAAPPLTWWLLFSVLATAGVLGHGLSVVQLAAQGASLVLLPHRARARALVLFAGAAIPPVLVALVLFRTGGSEVAPWIPELSGGQVVDVAATFFGPIGLLLVPALALVGVGTWVSVRRAIADPAERWPASIPVVWGLLPPLLLVLISVVRPYLIGRYLVASAPAIALLAAVGARAIDHRLRSARSIGRLRSSASFGIGSIALVLLLVWGQVQTRQDIGYDWRSAARQVAAQSRPGDVIAFPNPDFVLPFAAEWAQLPDRPAVAPVPVFPSTTLDSPRRFSPARWSTEEHLATGPRLWMVHRTLTSARDVPLEQLIEMISPRYRIVSHEHYAGGVQVVLAVPR